MVTALGTDAKIPFNSNVALRVRILEQLFLNATLELRNSSTEILLALQSDSVTS